MNVVCPACERTSELSHFRWENDTLFVRCTRCAVETQVRPQEALERDAVGATSVSAGVADPARVLSLVRGAPGVRGDADPFEVPVEFCPKCISERAPGASACRFCGLMFDQFRPEELHLGPALRAAFKRLVQDGYALESRHDEVLRLAIQHGELAQLGRLYRIQLARFPSDRMAQRGRDQILRHSLESVGSMPSTAMEASHRLRTAVIVGILVMATVMAAIVFSRILRGGLLPLDPDAVSKPTRR